MRSQLLPQRDEPKVGPGKAGKAGKAGKEGGGICREHRRGRTAREGRALMGRNAGANQEATAPTSRLPPPIPGFNPRQAGSSLSRMDGVSPIIHQSSQIPGLECWRHLPHPTIFPQTPPCQARPPRRDARGWVIDSCHSKPSLAASSRRMNIHGMLSVVLREPSVRFLH